MPEFLGRPRESQLAGLIAQMQARRSDPIAQGILQAGQAIGGGIARRGENIREDAATAARTAAAEKMRKEGGIMELLGKGGTFAGPGGAPADLATLLPGIVPQGMTYTAPQERGAIKITPEILVNYPQIQKMGYAAGDMVPSNVFNAQTAAQKEDRTRVEVTPELAKKYRGLIVGSMVPSTYMASLEQQSAEAATKAGEKKEGKILPASNVLALNEGKTVARLLPDVEAALKEAESVMGPISGRLGAANPYNTKMQTLDARFRTASQAFGRFMEGGVLRKEDEEKYRKMFPQLGDKPQVAKNKLDIVRRQLAQKYEDDRVTMGKSGYDVSGFEALEIPPSIFGKENKGGKGGAADVDSLIDKHLGGR